MDTANLGRMKARSNLGALRVQYYLLWAPTTPNSTIRAVKLLLLTRLSHPVTAEANDRDQHFAFAFRV